MNPPRWGRISAEALGVAAVVGLAFGWMVLPARALITVDGFYHLTIGRLIVSDGPWVDIRWLPYTVLGEVGPDHHWLFHLLISPFGLIGDRFLALKLASIVMAALVAGALCAIARRRGVPWAWAFALLAVTGALIVPGRLLMLRTQNLAVIFIALALALMHARRLRALGLVSFLFMQSYHGAVILGPLALLHLGLVAARERRMEWRVPAAVLAGALLGLLASPWFPENVEYLLFHTFFKVGQGATAAVGREWIPVPWLHLLTEAWPVHLALAGGIGAARWRGRLSSEALLWLLASLLLLVLYRFAWRFAEYYVPIGALTAGILLRDARPAEWGHRWARVALLIALAICAAWTGARGLALVQHYSEFVPEKYEAVGEYLRARAEPGDVVFNAGWEDFVFLLWHDDRLRYVTGLDPHYLAYADRARFGTWLWLRAVEPTEANDPAPVIHQRFGARWAVVPRGSTDGLAARLARSPYATMRVSSRWGWLFEIDVATRQRGLRLGVAGAGRGSPE